MSAECDEGYGDCGGVGEEVDLGIGRWGRHKSEGWWGVVYTMFLVALDLGVVIHGLFTQEFWGEALRWYLFGIFSAIIQMLVSHG